MKVDKPLQPEQEQTTDKQDAKREHREHGGNIVFALILIFAGVLFLANNLGIIPWFIWTEIWRFWPVFLILLGVQMIFGRSVIARIFLAIVTVSALLFILIYVLSINGVLQGTGLENYGSFFKMMPGRYSNRIINDEINISAEAFSNVSLREIKINAGIGKLTLRDTSGNDYFSLKSEYPESFGKPEVETDYNDGKLSINLRLPGQGNGFNMPMMGGRIGYAAELPRRNLNTSLELHVGAGETDAVFNTLNISKMTADVGVGSANITLDTKSIPVDGISLNVGVGSIVLNVPEGIGLSINHHVGIGRFSIDGQEIKSDGDYRTDNYDSADKKLQITAKAGTGSIVINRK